MSAKEYLASQLMDEWAEPCSVQTRKGLTAYAVKMHEGKDGYSIQEAEILIHNCGCGDEFTEKCISFLSNTKEALGYLEYIPNFDE